MINLPGGIVLPLGVAKIFQNKKILRYDKFGTDILDLIVECFGLDGSCQNLYFLTTYKLPILHYSSSGSLQG